MRVHCCTKFHVFQFLVSICMLYKHASSIVHCSLMWCVHKCIVYQQIMTTMLSQHCWNIAVNVIRLYLVLSVVSVSVPFTELHEHAYLHCSCFDMKVHYLPTNYGNLVVRFLTFYCCTK